MASFPQNERAIAASVNCQLSLSLIIVAIGHTHFAYLIADVVGPHSPGALTEYVRPDYRDSINNVAINNLLYNCNGPKPNAVSPR
jgi:hypothetical protein